MKIFLVFDAIFVLVLTLPLGLGRCYRVNAFLGILRSAATVVDLNALAAPDVGIVTDLLSISDVVAMDSSLDFSITFKLPPNQFYRLTGSNRQLFNSSLAENIPEVSWKPKHDTHYSLAFLDIDYPKGRYDEETPVGEQFLLWLATRIENPKIIETVPVKYIAPVPLSESTGNHRFVFVLMEEGADTPYPVVGLRETVADDGEVYTDRNHFNLTAFRLANNLRVAAVDYFISPPLPSPG